MKDHADSKALQWFRRSLGDWKSDRRYLFAPSLKPANMVTNFTVSEGSNGNQFVIQWEGQTSGTMETELNGLVLSRSRDYFGEENHSSTVEVVDSDCIVLRTAYDGMKIREEIRLLVEDTVRLRQTIGIDERTGNVRLCGQYFEQRV